MSIVITNEAHNFIHVLLLLLEMSSLNSLLVVLASMLHHIGTRLFWGFWWSILCPSLLFNIKTSQQILTEIFCLLCFRAVAKFIHDGGNLAIIPPATNLSGKTCPSCSSSLTISWNSRACSTTQWFSTILKSWYFSITNNSCPASAAPNLCSTASHSSTTLLMFM